MPGELVSRRGAATVHLRKTIDATEAELLDGLSMFAVSQDLEVDHTYDGRGLVFRRGSKSRSGKPHLFKRGDALHVAITAIDDEYDVEFTADVSDSLAGRTSRRRTRVIRGGVVSVALLGAGGVAMLHSGVGVGDLLVVMFGVGYGRGAVHRVQTAARDQAAFERKVANRLARLCAEIEDPSLIDGRGEAESSHDDDGDDDDD